MRLEVKGVSKHYNHTVALENFYMNLGEGIYGLLGSNGAGKTTLMNLLTDNITRDAGEILYDGADILTLGGKYRGEVGYMPQQQGYYDYFTVEMFLYYMAELKLLPKKSAGKEIEGLLQAMNLSDVKSRKMRALSGGMRQRALLAQALLGDPSILILDEPTAGLDPEERIRIRNLISGLSRNKIILLATHVVNDVECIADQVILMRQGRIVREGTPYELIASLHGHVAEISCEKQDLAYLQRQYPMGNVLQRKEGLVYRIMGDSLPEGARYVEQDINLEDVYLYYLKK